MNGNNILFSYKNNILEEETIFFLLKKKIKSWTQFFQI